MSRVNTTQVLHKIWNDMERIEKKWIETNNVAYYWQWKNMEKQCLEIMDLQHAKESTKK